MFVAFYSQIIWNRKTRSSVLLIFFFLHQPSKKAKLEESSDDERFLVLKNGARMPRVQFGTYRIKGTGCLSAVLSALRLVSQSVVARHRFFLVGFFDSLIAYCDLSFVTYAFNIRVK
jgi:hypothetical protein